MRGVVTRFVIPLLLFVTIAAVVSYPLVFHLSDRLPGQVAGDNLSFLWNLWWMRQAGAGFFWTPLLFAPFGIDLALHTHTALQAAVAATLLGRADVVTAQNVIIIATLTANGFAAYLLAKDRTSDTAGALLAGVLFGTATYVAVHLLGHFSLISTWTLPLFLLCLLRTLERRSILWSVLCGVSLVACAYTDYYYTVYCLVSAAGLLVNGSRILTVHAAPRPLTRRAVVAGSLLLAIIGAAVVSIAASHGFDRQVLGIRVRATGSTNLLSAAWLIVAVLVWLRVRPRLEWTGSRASAALISERLEALMPAIVVSLIGALPLIVHVGRLWMLGDYASPPHSWRSSPGGIDLVTLFIGSPLHSATGPWTAAIYDRLGLDPIESVGWLGIVPTLFLLWGIRRAGTDAQIRRFVIGGAAFFIWALGPWLRVGGINTGLMLPANLFGLLPILSNARMPGRAIVVTILAAALLAARYVADTPRSRKALLAGGAGLLAVLESLAAPFPLIPMPAAPQIYTALASRSGGAVCELPMGLRDGFGQVGAFDDRSLQYQMLHGHPILGGFAARVPSSMRSRYEGMPVVRSLLRLSDASMHDPDPRDMVLTRTEIVAALESASIRFIVLDRSRASHELVSFVESFIPAASLARDGDRELFAVSE